MRPYKVLITSELFTLSKPSSAERQKICGFLEGLAKDPFQKGDYQEADAVGREVQIKLIDRYAFTFWTDHPVEEVKVVRVEIADGY